MDPWTRRHSAPDDAEPIYTVGELTRELRGVLESRFDRIAVRGEVTNLGRPRSGHLYFSLVDDGPGAGSRFTTAQIPVVLWRSSVARLRFRLESGMKVVVSGRISVYEPRGSYQVIADRVVPEGVGELQLAFEELREKLRAEGLFDEDRKRPLPFLPRRIGLVTSPSGAAVRDFLTVLYERFPGAWVRLIPVRVQGEDAGAEIAAALDLFHLPEPQVDVIVLTRGGGSLEDLWAFNEERVARAIARSRIPCVSAVGHEVDFTIADFVADCRAPTPTAAARSVVPDANELSERLALCRRRLGVGLRTSVERGWARLERVARSRPLRDPQLYVQEKFAEVDAAAEALENSLYNHWRRWNDALFTLSARLESLSPFSVLERGYSVTTTSEGRVVRRAGELQRGEPVVIRLADGRVRARVEETEEGKKSEEAAGSGGDETE